jgi:hypothetical protein
LGNSSLKLAIQALAIQTFGLLSAGFGH